MNPIKKKIFVLDVFTNGHEAALAFIKSQGWTTDECEIIFCGTHLKVLESLSRSPGFAVVPIYNSIAGEVAEVTGVLERLRSEGYELEEIAREAFQIDHYLMVGQHVTSAAELQIVLSHEKAIKQCEKSLAALGIDSGKTSKSSSTGNAANAVRKAGSHQKIGAIAPRAAAEEYGLKILAEHIQDTSDNKTTFILLQNQAVVKSVTVGIIGINGRFGQTLKIFFEGLGCNVIGSDRDTELKKTDVVQNASVIIFAVPIKKTSGIISRLAPLMRPDQLILDVTSIKKPAIDAMLKSAAQVLGLHPMFKPGIPFEGQTIVACPARLDNPEWKTWAMNMLAATKAKIKWSDPVEHDRKMVTVQANPHLSNIVNALLIARTGVSVSDSLDFTSPFYRLMFATMGRLVGQGAGLYSAIAIENPLTADMLEMQMLILAEVTDIVRRKDYKAFEKLFNEARIHFGDAIVREADDLFLWFNAVQVTLYGTKSVKLQFLKTQNRPGLLHRMTEVFARREVNLTGIHSVELPGKHMQFCLGFEAERSSNSVRLSLDEIESWTDVHVRVLE